MTSLVERSSELRLGKDELTLSQRLELDIEFARRRSANPLRRVRTQRFVILDEGVERPDELKESQFHDITVSEIRLPATEESRLKVRRAIEKHEDTCHDCCAFDGPALKDCRYEIGAIFYVVTTRIHLGR